MTFESKFKDKTIDDLFKAILLLETEEECYRFFEDICTVSELKSLSQRLEVAKMLLKDRTYSAISEATGASTATISRVRRALEYGANGYKLVLQRLKETDEEKEDFS